MRFQIHDPEKVLQILIRQSESEALRLHSHLDAIHEPLQKPILGSKPRAEDPTITVLKERSSILASIEHLVSDAESQVWLMLGKWGAMHLARSTAFEVVNEVASRGVDVRILVDLDKRVLPTLDKFDPRIEIRHASRVQVQGAIIDEDVAVLMVSSENEPIGRGKDESALIIEANEFIRAHLSLVQTAWAEATSLDVARRRIADGRIYEPLRVTLGEGSFYHSLRNHLDGEKRVSNARLRTAEGTSHPPKKDETAIVLSSLGVDSAELLRIIAHRIGQEIADTFGPIEDDGEFWSELAMAWDGLGWGSVELIHSDEGSSIRINDGGSCNGRPNLGLGLCILDEGILEGILSTRFEGPIKAKERMCTSEGKTNCHFELEIGPRKGEGLKS